MSYSTYTTEALVCGTFKRNTSDASYLLFTKEAGMLYADARSVREEKSRQRFALQDFSLIRVSLVKGKRGWKIGSVSSIKNYYNEAVDKLARGSVVSLFRFLRRFLKGEEVMTGLYEQTIEYLELLAKEIANRSFVEEVAIVQLMAELGYVDHKKIPAELSEIDLAKVTKDQVEGLEGVINDLHVKAIAVSHL